MTSEMIALLTAYFLYHGDAGWGWWFVWGLIFCLYVLQSIGKARMQRQKEISDIVKYWENK